MQLYLVLALVFALMVAIFAVQNTTIVAINFLIWKFKISLVLVILGAASIGALCIFLVGLFKNITFWRKQRELQAKNKMLVEKNEELQNKLKEMQEKTEEDEEVQATNKE